MTTLGFIIIRHISKPLHSIYYVKSYEHIRKYYPDNQIVIIDDYLNEKYIDKSIEEKFTNTIIVKSEYQGRGELLPYVYYIKNKYFDIAVILHDSVFINSDINLYLNENEDYKIIWHFKNELYDPKWLKLEKNLLKRINNNDLLKFYYRKKDWRGCFGAMSIVRYDYLQKINELMSFTDLTKYITDRNSRMVFERIIACLFQMFDTKYLNYYDLYKNNQNDITLQNYIENDISLLGNIIGYCRYNLKYNDKIFDNNKLPIIKVWTGR